MSSILKDLVIPFGFLEPYRTEIMPNALIVEYIYLLFKDFNSNSNSNSNTYFV